MKKKLPQKIVNVNYPVICSAGALVKLWSLWASKCSLAAQSTREKLKNTTSCLIVYLALCLAVAAREMKPQLRKKNHTSTLKFFLHESEINFYVWNILSFSCPFSLIPFISKELQTCLLHLVNLEISEFWMSFFLEKCTQFSTILINRITRISL